MAESIRRYKNNDELIKELEDRNLIFPDDESKKIFKSYLSQYGYSSFVKKTSNPLMYKDVDKKTFKEEFTSNNLRYLFDIERNTSSIVFKYFRSVEFYLNSSILKVIAKKLNKNAKCPYLGAMNDEGFSEIFPRLDENMSRFKKTTKDNISNLFEDFYKNIKTSDFDYVEVIEQNRKEEHKEIRELIADGWLTKYIYKTRSKKGKSFWVQNGWEYIDIFSLFQTLTFSQLIRVFSYLSTSSKNEVIREFCAYFNPKDKYKKLKEESFEELLTNFSNLRNILMHNGYTFKFKYVFQNEDNKKEIENYFNIEIIDGEARLNEIIKIMESLINIKGKIFDEIKHSVKEKINNRTRRSDNISNLLFEIIENESRIKLQ